jgi:D-arabinonate dehydratase/D-galactarolactone cycloisomerase
MHRRSFLAASALVPVVTPSFAMRPLAMQVGRAADRTARIAKVEAIVIRSPNNSPPKEKLVEVPPVGALTGGVGLWNRLDELTSAYAGSYSQATLVKITTEQGVVGWGQCHAPVAPTVHKAIVTDLFAPLLIGQDAHDVQVLWDRLYASERLRGFGKGFFSEALAGVDLALWDVLGKHTGLPVYRLLGGKYRDELPTYGWLHGDSATEYRESALHAVAQGYTAVKMNMRGLPEFDRVAAVSKAIGEKAQVLVVCIGLKLYEAVKIGEELDRLGNVGWLQEPLLPEDASGYSKLANAITTPVCYGAFLGNRFAFREALAAGAVDIINPDISYCGGITECRRIAVLAEAFGVPWSAHVSMGAPPYLAASMHLAAATSNFLMMESQEIEKGPFGNVLLKEPLEFRPGFARVPNRPGLGIEFNETELAKVTAV